MKRFLAAGLIGLLLLATFPPIGYAETPPPSEPPRGEINRFEKAKRGETDLLLHLAMGAVDPATLPAEERAAADGPRLYVVQFHDVITDESHAVLKEAGVEVGPYLPQFAFVVRMTADQANRVRQHRLVRAVTPFRSEWKLSPALAKAGDTLDLAVATFPRAQGAGELRSRVKSLSGAKAVEAHESGFVLHGANKNALLSLAEESDVLFIDVVRPMQLFNDVARGIMRADAGANSPWSLGLKGEGQVVAVADSGLDTGIAATLHPDLASRLHKAYARNDRNSWSDPHGHGTHVAGSVLGTGAASNGQYAGVAPKGKLIVQSIMNGDESLNLATPADIYDLLTQAKDAGAHIHTNSWGALAYGIYDSGAQAVDQFVWSNKRSSVLFAAGNSGLWGITSPGTAKNVITVGASESYRPELGPDADDPNEVAWFSSWGPADDGRIKPDVVAPGTWILSTRYSLAPAKHFWAEHENPAYAYSGGTSMATPLVAGAAALVREGLQKKGISNPSAALVKATLINGAQEMGWGFGDWEYGWGRVDLVQSLKPDGGRSVIYKDVTTGLSTGGEHSYTFNMKAGQMIRFTLAWTDYPGAPFAERALVNDLDLIVIGPDGKQYLGNCFDLWGTTVESDCAYPTEADAVNNVENVYLATPTDGTYTVKVRGFNVPQGPQPYALVASGILKDTTKPTVKILSPKSKALVKGVVEVSFQAQDNMGIGYAEVYEGSTLLATLDGQGPSGTYTYMWDTPTLAQDGARTLTVKVYDFNGNTATSSVSVVVDNQGPVVGLANLQDGALVRGKVNVTANVQDESPAAKVEFRLDGAQKATDTSAPFTWTWDTAKSPDGEHTVSATAYDKAGNAVSAEVHLVVDNKPPTVALVTPESGASLRSSVIEVVATAEDSNGVTKVEFFVGSTRIGTDTDVSNGWATTWNTAAVKPGNYTVKAVATDRAGNTSTASATVTVDSAKPTVSITSPKANAKLTGTVTVSGTARDNKRVAAVEIWADDVKLTTLTPPKATTSYAFKYDWATSGDGPRALAVVVTDAAGNVTVQPVTVYVDHTDPEVTITAPASGTFAGKTTTITADASDNLGVARVEFYATSNGKTIRIGEDKTAPYSINWNTSQVQSGTYSLKAKVYDAAGRSAESEPVTVTVDKTAPKATVTLPPEKYLQGTVPITVTASDNIGVDRAEIFVGSTLLTTLDGEGTGQETLQYDWDTTTHNGRKTLKVIVYDLAGNSFSKSVSVTVDNAPPSLKIDAPKAGATVKGTVEVKATASDPSGIAKVEFYLDGNLMETDMKARYSWRWDTTTAANGSHELTVMAYDKAGNVKTITITVNVENP